MIASLIDSLKQHWLDFPFPWSWRVTTGKKQRFKYESILSACRMSQYVVAVLSLLIALCFDTSKQLLISAVEREGLLLFLIEVGTYCGLGYFIGTKRLPANYISLMIIRLYVILEKQYKPDVQAFRTKVLQQSRFQGYWVELSYNPKPSPTGIPVETIIRHLILFIFGLMALLSITKVSQFDLSNHPRTAVVANTVGTSTAALLLLTTFSFEAYPQFKPIHKRYCEIWVMFAATTLLFLITFIYQRYRRLLAGKLKPSLSMRSHWESVLFMVSLYIMLSYIPVIHRGFNTRKLLGDITRNLAETILPIHVWNAVGKVGKYTYDIGVAVANANAGLFYEDQFQ